MGKKKEHQNKLLELANEIMALGEAISRLEKTLGIDRVGN
jgi:hypothetical protein